MSKLTKLAVSAVFTFSCFTLPVLAAGKLYDGAGGKGKDDTTPAAVAVVKGEWSTGAVADQIKALQTQFEKERDALLARYRDLIKAAKDGSKEELEKVRAQFKIQREEMIARQKELRDELKSQVERFRKEHPEHQQLIDAAKEAAKEKIRTRRGSSRD